MLRLAARFTIIMYNKGFKEYLEIQSSMAGVLHPSVGDEKQNTVE